MRLVCISDAHWCYQDIDYPKGDVLIMAGDMGQGETEVQTRTLAAFLGTLPYKYKLYTPGNHNIFEEETPAQQLFEDVGVTYLIDRGVTIQGINIHMSPWTVPFMDWAFMKDETDLALCYKRVPKDTDILITHGPAFGILDQCADGRHVGSVALKKAVMKLKPKIHIVGHIHESYGIAHTQDTTTYNVSVCNANYMVCNAPTIIEL
jgi:hypothetical protein